jgi:hypothetical protein
MSENLKDRLYIVLEQGIPEFNELSPDRQGDLCYEFARNIKICIEIEKAIAKIKAKFDNE